jgi:hypothetical protein
MKRTGAHIVVARDPTMSLSLFAHVELPEPQRSELLPSHLCAANRPPAAPRMRVCSGAQLLELQRE